MDEVSLLIDLVSSNWSSSATTLQSAGTITADHVAIPNFVDVRTLQKNKGVRYDLTAKDVIIFFEDSQSLEYPTTNFDVRNETYNMTLHIRCIQDERQQGFENFGRDRLNSLYRITRYIIESNRKGSTITHNDESKRFDLITFGTRSESNDRNKRLFGYKINLTMKRFAISIP